MYSTVTVIFPVPDSCRLPVYYFPPSSLVVETSSKYYY
uniref:Uncharacterized protein n=1 Tax=Anguilla anguilla TaxID=7936 RepID=A0A0E9PYG8_ANGAN